MRMRNYVLYLYLFLIVFSLAAWYFIILGLRLIAL